MYLGGISRKGESHAVIKAISKQGTVWVPPGEQYNNTTAKAHLTQTHTGIYCGDLYVYINKYTQEAAIHKPDICTMLRVVGCVPLKAAVWSKKNPVDLPKHTPDGLPRGCKWSRIKAKKGRDTPVHLCVRQRKLLTILTSAKCRDAFSRLCSGVDFHVWASRIKSGAQPCSLPNHWSLS